MIPIIKHREYDKEIPSKIADEIYEFHRNIPNLWWFVDGANRGALNEVKSRYGESLDWTKSEDVNPDDIRVIPISFQKEHKQMLQHTY